MLRPELGLVNCRAPRCGDFLNNASQITKRKERKTRENELFFLLFKDYKVCAGLEMCYCSANCSGKKEVSGTGEDQVKTQGGAR